MRTLVILTTFLALLVPRAAAGEGDRVLTREDLELVPMDHTAFGLLEFEHRELFHHLEHCQDRLHELAELVDEDDGKPSAWHKAQEQAAAKDLAEAAAKLQTLLRSSGVDTHTLASIVRFPRGPRRVERYALAQVRGLSMGERETALVRQTAAATLGALLALDARLRVLPDEDAESDGGEPAGSRRHEQLEEQVERTRRRFWLLVDFVLDDVQKRALRTKLPNPMREVEDLFDHAMHLPKLSVGQMARVRALEAELESESGPDHTLAERLERQLDDEALSDPEREALHRQLEDTWLRVVRREHETKLRLQRVLTEAQRAFLQAIPPLVSVDQRLAEPAFLLRQVDLTEAQTGQLVPLVRELAALRRRVDTQMDGMHAQIEEMGADSPQAAGMEMREATVAGELIRKTHAAMRTVFLDVMTLDQVVQWVVVGASDEE